jgi:hypothetical protein
LRWVLVKNIVKEHGFTLDGSYGVGDTHRDSSLLKLVDNPIAFNPNAALYDTAIENGWPIVVERKNMIYEMQPNQNGTITTQAYVTHDRVHNEARH